MKYYNLLPTDLDEAWALLGPDLKAKGRKSYDAYWQQVQQVALMSSHTSGTSVQVTIQLTMQNQATAEEVHRLGMIQVNGQWLIDTDTLIQSHQFPGPGPSATTLPSEKPTAG